MTRRKLRLLAAALAAVCATSCPGAARAAGGAAAGASFSFRSIPLPGAPPGGVFMDYIAYDRAHRRVWVPAGNTGSVDVIGAGGDAVARVEGFPTAEVERRGGKHTVGPSSVTVGDGVVFVGNRADSKVCAIDAVTLRRGACAKLESMPDGLAYVASTREVWVTTPRARSIAVLDASRAGALTPKAVVTLDGQPEGFAVDDARGVFYTNLEDKDRTLVIDLGTRKTSAAWLPECGGGGPKGLALDQERAFLLVACSDKVRALDARRGGRRLSTIETGEGVDNIDYVESRHELYAAAARAAKLTVATLDEHGALTPRAAVPTAAGARNAVATEEGTAYLTDSAAGRILVVAPAPRAPSSADRGRRSDQ